MHKSEDWYVPMGYASMRRARLAVSLPDYVDANHIGINLDGLNRLCLLGGINHLRVTSSQGEISRITPTVIGMDSQGNAYAGRKVERIAEDLSTIDSKISEFSTRAPHSMSWINIHLDLNISEMANRIGQSEKWNRNVRSTEAWADQIDTTLRDGITRAGARHLSYGLTKGNWGWTAYQYGFMSFVESLKNPSLEGLIIRFIGTSLILNFVDFCRSVITKEDYRWSLFYGPQLDRALILLVMSRVTNLAKPLTSNS